MNLFRIALPALALLPAHSSWAESQLDPIIITATRQPVALTDHPGQAEVLTGSELEKKSIQRLSDALNTVPGLAVQPGRGPLQGIASMSLRGIPDERRMLFLVDGLPMNDGYAGSVNLAAIPVNHLDQVEVLYGPASALYGGTAMGGVISFRTRMPTENEFRFGLGFGQPFSANKAPENVRRGNLSAGTRFANGLSVLAGASWMSTDGYRNEAVTTGSIPAATTGAQLISATSATPAFQIGWKGATRWQEDGQFLKLEQAIGNGNRWRAAWQRQSYDSSGTSDAETLLRSTLTGLPTLGGNDVSFLTGRAGYERQTYSLGGDFNLAAGVLTVNAAYLDVPVNFQVSPITATAGRIGNTTSDTRTLEAYWNRTLEQHALTLGASWREDRALAQDDSLSSWQDKDSVTALYAKAGGKARMLGFYIQDNWQFAERWTAHLGLRYDHWRNFDGNVATPGWPLASRIFRDYDSRTASAWSPKLALRYQVNDALALRTSVGSAFRAPTVFELYRTSRIGTRTFNANPELDPETVRTLDIGADLTPWQGGDLHVTAFLNRMHDLIYSVSGATANTRDRVNAELAESHGITMNLRQRFTQGWQLRASYTYTDSSLKRNSRAPSAEGKQLTFLPRNQATLGADWQRGAWLIGSQARYVGKQYSEDTNIDTRSNVPRAYDAYFVADIKASYRINPQLSASLAIDNLFNRKYYSFYLAPQRNWFASLNYSY